METLTDSTARLSLEDNNNSHTSLAQSIKELEESLQDPKLSQDERKKLKRRLKKKRQKERKRTAESSEVDDIVGDDEEDDDDDDADDDDEEDGAAAQPPPAESTSFLSDLELSRMLDNASNVISPKVADAGIIPATSSVKRRLKHSPFVTCNFGYRQDQADSKLMGLLQSVVDVRRPSSKELAADLDAATEEGGGGLAEIAFMLRAFTPEEELADGVSAALGDIPWEMTSDRAKREW